jgi:cysteine-rich repeat protein
MRRITGLLLGLTLFAGAGQALAQVDCTGGCTTTKYGLGIKSDYRKDEYPPDAFRYIRSDFGPDVGGVSYFMSRTDPDDPTAIGSCGPERSMSPVPGMVFLKEQTDCTPTGTGPTCVGGANDGKLCHLGINPIQLAIECPGGTCTDSGGGCRVEIPLDTADGGRTPPETTSELKIFTTTFQATVPGSNPPTFYNLTAQTGNTFGGSSDDSNPLCPIRNIRRKPSMATRYLLPEDRRTALGLPAGATFLRWDSAFGLVNATGCDDATCARANNATNFRYHTDDTRLCCVPNQAGDCSRVLGQNSPEYPLLTNRRCETSTRPFTNDDNIVADWVFVGGRNSQFFTDPNHVNPGQLAGLCKVNRQLDCYAAGANTACTANKSPFQCCTGAGTGNCDDSNCTALGDVCDFTEPGHRVQVACGYDGNGDARRDCCGGALYVLRGYPNQHCTLLPRMQYDGDPGPACSYSNYGIDHRYDDDCNGVADHPDLCPFLTEWNQTADGDGDCANGPGGDCRGDECECGDQVGGPENPVGSGFRVGEGKVTVADLVATNLAIFNPLDGTKRSLLSDANNDVVVNVSDIVAVNLEIFRPDSSICRAITPRQCGLNVPTPCCGDGNVTTGESCDDNNLNAGDGCNAACRIEFGFTCTGSPSVCTHS